MTFTMSGTMMMTPKTSWIEILVGRCLVHRKAAADGPAETRRSLELRSSGEFRYYRETTMWGARETPSNVVWEGKWSVATIDGRECLVLRFNTTDSVVFPVEHREQAIWLDREPWEFCHLPN